MFFSPRKATFFGPPSSSSSLQKASSTFPGGNDCMISRVLSPFLVYPRSHPGFLEEPDSHDFRHQIFEPRKIPTSPHVSPIFPVGICLRFFNQVLGGFSAVPSKTGTNSAGIVPSEVAALPPAARVRASTHTARAWQHMFQPSWSRLHCYTIKIASFDEFFPL